MQDALHPGKSLFSVLSESDDFGDHRIKVGRNGVTLFYSRVDSDAWAGWYAKTFHQSRRRRESVVRILSVQPHLNRVARGGGRMTLQAPAPRNVNLQFDQIHAGRALGYWMFHLQARVHLHEQETLGCVVRKEIRPFPHFDIRRLD